MSIQVQVVANDKARWADGALVMIARDKKFIGSDQLLKGLKSLQPTLEQFDSNPCLELTGFVSGEKKNRSVIFLSTKQVKHYSDADKLRILGSRAVKFAEKSEISQLVLPAQNTEPENIEAILQGMASASYKFDRYKTSGSKNKAIKVLVIIEKDQVKTTQTVVKRFQVVDESVNFARDLVNEIPAELFPDKMASLMKNEGKAAGLDITVYDEKRLAKENFNGILTVGKGSNKPPRLTLLKYNPAKSSDVHLCLVGKAVTFDTGGHCLKSGKSMWEMKGDMAGGAAVAGAMLAIGKLKPRIKVTGIIPSALNAIGPEAMLPGDIIKSRSGKTVHVDNTDAEGRLLLMDGLHLAQEIGATHIVDVATLTGSIVRALGQAMSGLFANDDEIARAIIESGASVGEDYWRMPLIEEYREQLNHPVADIDNMGKGNNGGAIVAALFLKEFITSKAKWAHLDIAACGLFTKAYKYTSPGGSGFGVKTLVQLAENLSQTKS